MALLRVSLLLLVCVAFLACLSNAIPQADDEGSGLLDLDASSEGGFDALFQQVEKEFGVLKEDLIDTLCADMDASVMDTLSCNEVGVGAKIAKEWMESNIESADDLTLSPVVLFPGLGGSAMEAKLDKDEKPAWYCKKKTKNWFLIWLQPLEVLVQKCWFNNLDITYDNATNTYANTEGVELRPLDFGGVKGVAYLDYLLGKGVALESVYGPLIDTLQAVGYKAGTNLVGVPYDWRFPTQALWGSGFVDNVQALIEQTYTINGNTPVSIVTHSMGGVTSLWFLNNMTQAWKDTYVKNYIPIAGPWAGASKSLRAIVTGDNFGLGLGSINLVAPSRFRDVAREAGGPISLIPRQSFYSTNYVFVRTPTKNYTANDFPQLFEDMGSPITNQVYQAVENVLEDLTSPKINNTYCLYGVNVSTEFSYTYPDGDFSKMPEIEYEESGDGTVPIESLLECHSWALEQPQPVGWKEFDMGEHSKVLKDPEVLGYVLNIVTGQPNAQLTKSGPV
eukprot:TRINITY_DN15601_c0_g1_i1.p1 TRINITY_DN15601_c0_g1~~TRINITY_DN15601_c0_g1_i1.p1  ORF type:complete len:526 (+),score=135.36 TRINITY_DN15601_c0_g1_i1:61-1578(+)